MSPIGVGKTRTNKAKQTVTPKLWLLLIGVNQYLDEDLPSLRYSALDCRGLSEALEVACQQFSQMEMTTFHDFGLQLPLLGDIRGKLAEIKVNAKPEDTVLFYFSGHGVIDGDTQQTFLCLRDTQKDDLANSAIALHELLSILGSCAARQQLIWLDACHSGGMTLRGAVPNVMLNPTRQLVRDLQSAAASSKGFYALLSCDTDQQSWEFPELGHGVFTYYLIRGLRGEAADSQGMVTADGLYRYVYHQTLQYLDKTNQQLRLINQQRRGKGDTNLYSEYPLQTPKRIVEGIGEIVLGNKSVTEDEKRVALVVDGVTSSQTLALSKVLQGNGGFELEYLPRQGKASVTDIRDAIQGCLSGGDTALLYLRGRLEETPGGESALVLADDVWLSCSWLRQRLRRALVERVVLILDCPEGGQGKQGEQGEQEQGE